MERVPSRELFLRCIDCGCDFIWSESEQDFYRLHQLKAPRRCPHCRPLKKARFLAEERKGYAVK